MKIFKTTAALTAWRQSLPLRARIGFVPTMGALHEGHLTLVRRMRRENDIAVVSIFVNPLQFGPKEDFKRYPRPWARDLALLKKAGASVIFAPAMKSMYSPGFSTQVFVRGLSETLCGAPASRGPRHFLGVATVVAKLFNLVRPARAYFGMKDFQQVRILEQMNQDLDFGIQIVRCPTVREADGLALSSRNAYLTPPERALAPRLAQALQYGRKLLTSRPSMTPNQVQKELRKTLSAIPNVNIDYIELVDPVTLQKSQSSRRPILIAAALKFKSARLIDNLLVP